MNAMQQLLTEHMAIWTAADTEKKSGRGRASGNAGSVYGIKKLRELILELAVRGKLVSQDANDEPASDLLKRIQAEKAKLIVPIHEDEKPFELPNGWEHVRLGILFDIVYGKGLSNSELTEDGYDVFGANGIIGKYPKYLYEEPQLLISCRGAYSGKPNISPSKCFVTSNSLVLGSSWKNIDLKYFYYSLSIANKEKIVTGTAQPQVTTTNLEPFVVGLPPLAEQYRIVAKVDELMALCDQLEAQHSNAAEAHEKLVSYLLGTFTQSQSADDFSTSWQRIAAHFDTLFTTETSIDELKQTLLQLAVMGKLVPQDANDESASELLKRIQADKAKLVAEGKIKKDKPFAPIGEDEKPYASPTGWTWVRLNELLTKIGAGSTPHGGKQVYVQEGVPFLRSQNVWDDGLRLDDVAFITSDTHKKMSGTHVYSGDLLFNITGASIGRCAIVPNDFVTGNVSQHVTIIRLASNQILRFMHLVLISQHVQQTVMDVQVGVSREGLSIAKLGQFVIPIPPLVEQNRIVAKVDALMAICDQLKTRITAASQQQQTIANVLVAQVLN
jgi:type I restriction enzyme S subunit